MNAAKQVAETALPALRVRCPSCHRAGTLFSKWVKGTPVKPLYIVHTNGNGHFKACLLDKQQAVRARSKIGFTAREVIKIMRVGKPFVLFSGGADSLCLLEYMRRLAERANLTITALHADTTAGFPEVEDYVKKTCKQLDVPLVTVRPTHDFFDLAKRWGIPGVKSRWCCETLKVAPIRRYLATVDGPKVVFDGIRAAESNLRATYTPVWYHPAFRSISVSPLFRWSDSRVESYIERNNLPRSPASQLGTSAECWCGAYKCPADFRKLLDIHPDIFGKLVEVEEAQGGKYTFIYKKGKRIPLASLKAKRAPN
jgi:3'-phosphoadenosine 5'-phosphosulfate sulfotransferase (PAPS reductase)/FAD synthetase